MKRGNSTAGLFRCRICHEHESHRSFVAREMMLGLRERFDYVECGRCGTLQIRDIPHDLGRFYGDGYYAFDTPYRAPRARRWLKRILAAVLLRMPEGIARRLQRLFPAEVEWLRRAGVGLDASILDVGAGAGQVLLTLWDYGARRLLGVDPYIERELEYAGGVRVLRRRLEDVEGRFDVVMFHHSLEHVPDPIAALGVARDRLAEGGVVLVRIPVASESWRRYGPDWVELDPPRHLHVPTVEGFHELARRAGLRVDAVSFDTGPFELWGSEQYARGIPLTDPRSHAFGGAGRVFGRSEMKEFERRARELNATGRAGRAAFWLRPVGEEGSASARSAEAQS